MSLTQFEQFVLPYLSPGSRGPAPKLDAHTIFNYILRVLYIGCQWKELPIEKDEKAGLKFTTPASTAHSGAGRQVAASMQSLLAQY